MSEELIKALANKKYNRAIKILAREDFLVSATDSDGKTAMHLAAEQGYADLLSKLERLGFDKQAEDNMGQSPLHAAVYAQQLQCTEMLLSLGADVNSLDQWDQTPLHLAVQENLYLQVRLLVQNGANVNARDSDNRKPIEYTKGKFNRIKFFLEKPYNDLDASDTDSEDELNYQYSDDDILTEEMEALTITENEGRSKTNVFAHYRGLHFYEEYFTRQQRKESRTLHRNQDKGIIQRLGIYSAATHEKAGVTLEVTNTDKKKLKSREKKLEKANEDVAKKMCELKSTGSVSPCLAHSSTASRDIYDSRYLEYTQRYVNSYKTLIADMAIAQNKKIDGRSSGRTREKWQIFKNLGFTKIPFVSTSEDVAWGLEYATAMLNWDKTDTNQPRHGNDITVLTPGYQADGHCRFPYLGILYVTLHSRKELSDGLSTRILDLFSQDQIDLNGGPGGHVKSGYVRARERVFIGGIDGNHVKLSTEVRVPSFYFPYRDFMKKKYGIDKSTYENFKTKLERYGSAIPGGKMKNEKEFFRTEKNIIQYVIQAQKTIVEEKISAFATRLGSTLVYAGVNENTIRRRRLPDIAEFELKNKEEKAKKAARLNG